MSDKLNKYPAHDKIDNWRRRWLFADSTKLCEAQDVITEFQSLLADRQRDEEMIERLIQALKKIKHVSSKAIDNYENEHSMCADGVYECVINNEETADTAINAAELRLKEGV